MRILFIHHSTGANIIRQGKLRNILYPLDPSIELWDHSYNLYPLPLLLAFPLARLTYHSGLSDGQGHILMKDFNIVLSNNSPKEYAELFSREPTNQTLHNILAFDVIAFKNCYPTTKIVSNDQLEEYKTYYLTIRESVKRYPDKTFILLTPPPLREECTSIENAHRAQELVRWLTSEDFLSNTPNLKVFDLFTLLADKDGFLRHSYTRPIPIDSHPNRKANKEVAPVFATFLTTIH